MRKNFPIILNFPPFLFLDFLPDGLIWWTILLFLGAGVVALLIQLSQLKRRSKSTRNLGQHDNNEKFRELNRQIQSLQKLSVTADLENRLKIAEDKILELENPKRQYDLSVTNRIPSSTENTKEAYKNLVPDQEMFYAKIVDLPNGFSRDIISQLQNGEQVYEIQTKGDTAIYRISDDTNAQRYALTDYNYTLGKACEFLNQPFKGCQIILKKEGVLAKTAGNWIIQQKAHIEFK